MSHVSVQNKSTRVITQLNLFPHQEATGIVDSKSWPTILDTDDLPKRKLQVVYRAPTAEMICYLDFSVSTTGMLAGIKVFLLYTWL